MPDLQTIETALGQALAAVSGIPSIAWPNRGAEPDRPFVLFDHQVTTWAVATVDGAQIVAEGYAVAFVCISQGSFSTPANTIAAAIIAAFPSGRRLGGVCVQQARPLPGYFDGIGWRQPVRIDYRSGG